MERKEQPKNICKSVFKSAESTTLKKELTHKWIVLINMLERDKSIALVKRP